MAQEPASGQLRELFGPEDRLRVVQLRRAFRAVRASLSAAVFSLDELPDDHPIRSRCLPVTELSRDAFAIGLRELDKIYSQLAGEVAE